MSVSNNGDRTTYRLVLSGAGIKVDKTVDESVAAGVMALVMGGAATASAATALPQDPPPARRRAARRPASGGGGASPKRRKVSGSVGMAKDLSLRPRGKKPFLDFVAEKQPKTHYEKQVVIVYWLRHEAGMESGIGLEHINSCYQAAGWRRPSDLPNSLATTSTRRGWLDTADSNNILLTVPGEDAVVHEIPRTE